MRRLTIVAGLECYALILAVLQYVNGVRTDEAKYLLDIPYPHPPLARGILGSFDGWALHEHAARLLFATLLVQAVWIVWDMGRYLNKPARFSLCVLWLGSAALVIQAGTVMMAPLTALQALVFLWILSLPLERVPGAPAIGFLWLLTLFTALQGVLLAPLAVAALRLRGASWKAVAWYVGAPLALLGLYALGNPLVLASFVLHGGKDAADSFVDRAGGLLWIVTLAGSGVGTVIGIVGLILKKHWMILSSFVLASLYVFVGRYDYYAILFLPFFVTGAKHLWRRMPRLAVPSTIALVACTIGIVASVRPFFIENPPQIAMTEFSDGDVEGLALIVGSHGHEWQYHSDGDVEFRPYRHELLPEAAVVLCTDHCVELDPAEWSRSDYGSIEAWYRLR